MDSGHHGLSPSLAIQVYKLLSGWRCQTAVNKRRKSQRFHLLLQMHETTSGQHFGRLCKSECSSSNRIKRARKRSQTCFSCLRCLFRSCSLASGESRTRVNAAGPGTRLHWSLRGAAQPAATAVVTRSQCWGSLGELWADPDKLGPERGGADGSPRAGGDGDRASRALLQAELCNGFSNGFAKQ